MDRVAVVPRPYLGQSLDEGLVKRELRSLNPDFSFDWIGNHGKWHADIQYCQGVFYRDRHICTMDRGEIPEWPIWTVTDEAVEVPLWQIRVGEEANAVLFYCKYCGGNGFVAPIEAAAFMLGPHKNSDEAKELRRKYRCIPCSGAGYSDICHVVRKVRDKCILVGWQHTFGKIAAQRIPGASKAELEAKFRVVIADTEDRGLQEVSEDGQLKILERVAVAGGV